MIIFSKNAMNLTMILMNKMKTRPQKNNLFFLPQNPSPMYSPQISYYKKSRTLGIINCISLSLSLSKVRFTMASGAIDLGPTPIDVTGVSRYPACAWYTYVGVYVLFQVRFYGFFNFYIVMPPTCSM